MFILGAILLVLGLFGVLRRVLVPLGIVLMVIGAVWDVVAFVTHTVTAVF